MRFWRFEATIACPEKKRIIITRQLQSLVTVRELTSIETRQTVGLAIGWIDIVGFARPVI